MLAGEEVEQPHCEEEGLQLELGSVAGEETWEMTELCSS